MSGQCLEKFCDVVKRYRITAETVQCDDDKITWTTEQCAKIFLALKPVNIELNSQESDRFEALFQSKALVDLTLFYSFFQKIGVP